MGGESALCSLILNCFPPFRVSRNFRCVILRYYLQKKRLRDVREELHLNFTDPKVHLRRRKWNYIGDVTKSLATQI